MKGYQSPQGNGGIRQRVLFLAFIMSTVEFTAEYIKSREMHIWDTVQMYA